MSSSFLAAMGHQREWVDCFLDSGHRILSDQLHCTGTATFTPQGQSAINISIVIVNAGQELMFLETDNNTIVAGTLEQ